MPLETILVSPRKKQERAASLPSWFRQEIPNQKASKVKKLLDRYALNTVCVGARCPNQGICWGRGVATFMILGEHCTRNCRFCAVPSGETCHPDLQEPYRVAEAVNQLALKYVVITSVTRDDLDDQGVGQFVKTIEAIKELNPQTKVECLTPDFNNELECLKAVSAARVDVLTHNMETVKRIYERVRPESDYKKALEVLRNYKRLNKPRMIKSGFMVGMGETYDEVIALMYDLRFVGCDILTIGQYLSPSSGNNHLPVKRFWSPCEFDELKQAALKAGFLSVASGPLVRSSFMAEDIFRAAGN